VQCISGSDIDWHVVGWQDGQLDQNIDRMRYAVMDLLVRLSQRFAKRRQGTIFLINNFTHVCQVCPKCSSHFRLSVSYVLFPESLNVDQLP
jgi:hypothetical protein